MTVRLIDHNRDNEREFESRAEAEDKRNDLIALGADPDDIEITTDTKADGGPEVIDHPPDSEDTTDARERADLPDNPGVDTDPLDWVPSDFIDHIDGQPAINRKGYDVLAHHYDISVVTECRVSPADTGHEYAECVATATTADGVEYTAQGSASVDRGDDSHLLLEMADTRAAKRVTARATGVGMIAVQELQNNL